ARNARAAVLDAYERRADPDPAAAAAERVRLQADLDAAEAALKAARSRLQGARRASTAALDAFETFTDPRANVGVLPDRHPFVLFPVRIETRFATDPDGGNRLLVRIYPDDCSVDTFEELLSTTELENAKKYWRNIWRAGGVEDDERGAWRDLV